MNVYGLGVGISIVLRYSAFPVSGGGGGGGGLTPETISNVLHILPVTLSICF
jgi:hypothetical protein